MMDEQGGPGRPREGMSAWAGVIDAFREAIEETIDEMRQRSDLNPDRAKEAVRGAVRRAQSAVDDARERLDFVPRKEFDTLKEEVAELRRRLDERQGGGPAAPPPVPVDAG
ncbi:MAG: hypothetical protein ACRELD_06340 [Longimicrobiales bacterium]